MNPEIFLNKLAIAIESRDKTHIGMYILGINKGNAVCVPCTDKLKPQHPLGLYKGEDLAKGFSSAQWDTLSYRVAKAWAQEKI